MSRRHRGRPHHHAAALDGPRRGPGVDATTSRSPESPAQRTAAAAPPRLSSAPIVRLDGHTPVPAGPEALTPNLQHDADQSAALPSTAGPSGAGPVGTGLAPQAGPPAMSPGVDRSGQCTAPQLRRFIKSRPYVPMHELRRRFSIYGDDDDVTPVRINPGWIFVGLPNHEGHLLGELLRTGEIGYELSLDPRTPIVIGVYPMRPIPRA
jgi:hypothetical protein